MYESKTNNQNNDVPHATKELKKIEMQNDEEKKRSNEMKEIQKKKHF